MDNGSLDLGALLNFATQSPELIRALSSLLAGNSRSGENHSPPPFRSEGQNSFGLGNLFAGQNASGAERKTESSGVFSDPEENRKRIALLGAVRPYLSERRRELLDIVIKIMKLSELGGLSSLLSKL